MTGALSDRLEPNRAVLRLNRTIGPEAFRVGWEHTRICFHLISHLNDFQHAQATIPFKVGRKLRLEFDLAEYSHFFGFQDDEHPNAILSPKLVKYVHFSFL